MNHSNQMLNDIVEIARDGEDFYQHAATKVDDPELKALFKRIAVVKNDIVTSLSSVIEAAGEKPAESGTVVGDLSKLYGELRAHIGNKDYAYVAQLEQSEDRLLTAFKEAQGNVETTAPALAVLTRMAPEVRQCHEMMRSRKQAMKKAA